MAVRTRVLPPTSAGPPWRPRVPAGQPLHVVKYIGYGWSSQLVQARAASTRSVGALALAPS